MDKEIRVKLGCGFVVGVLKCANTMAQHSAVHCH